MGFAEWLAYVCDLGAANQNLPVLGASVQAMKGLHQWSEKFLGARDSQERGKYAKS